MLSELLTEPSLTLTRALGESSERSLEIVAHRYKTFLSASTAPTAVIEHLASSTWVALLVWAIMHTFNKTIFLCQDSSGRY